MSENNYKNVCQAYKKDKSYPVLLKQAELSHHVFPVKNQMPMKAGTSSSGASKFKMMVPDVPSMEIIPQSGSHQRVRSESQQKESCSTIGNTNTIDSIQPLGCGKHKYQYLACPLGASASLAPVCSQENRTFKCFLHVNSISHMLKTM